MHEVGIGIDPVGGGLSENKRGGVRFHHAVLAPIEGLLWIPPVRSMILNPFDPHGESARKEAQRQARYLTSASGVRHNVGFIREGQTFLDATTGTFHIHGVNDIPFVASEHLTESVDKIKGVTNILFEC